MKILWIVIGIAAALVLLGWIGFKIQPVLFPPITNTVFTTKMIPVPTGLPAPVARFYQTVYGEEMPVVESAVITGRAVISPNGLPFYMPARFRFTHIAGQGYRHYIEATIFGIPLIKVNERYVDGKSLFDIPGIGRVDNDPNTNQGANLGMWSESLWFPSIFLTDPRVHWEAVDDFTAVLIVPFEQSEERYIVRFNAKTGLVDYFESMRFQAAESTEKTLWMNQSREWAVENGKPRLKQGAAIWMDNGRPWAIFTVEDIALNVDVRDYILAEGP
jgi:hypothetical protein